MSETEHANHAVVVALYESFKKCDGEGMADCYADNATFSDPAFPGLHGKEVKGMWQMLCQTAKDLKIEYRVRSVDDNGAVVDWEAWYTFSKTGRTVHNIIEANIDIQNGKITNHLDHFDFWRWSKQSLGAAGLLLGWTPFLKSKVQGTARRSLERFLDKR